MKTLKHITLLAGISLLTFCTPAEKYETKTITEDGYTYETVTNDPLKLRIYTLKNGLKVYLSVNKDEPRIQTLIAVKAGSTYDPPETTGLAHYLEHMLFKGTSTRPGNRGPTAQSRRNPTSAGRARTAETWTPSWPSIAVEAR